MGSSSRSNSSQQTNNSSTSLGVQGDNTGFMTVGNSNSYNITTTDGGLVDGLVSIWGDMAGNQSDMINAVGNMASDNTNMVENVTGDAFNYASDVNRDSLDFADNVNRESLDFAGNVVGDSLGVVVDTISGALGFGQDALASNANLASDSINAQNYLAETTIKENSNLALSVAEMAESMHGNNTAFANNALLTTVDAISNSSQQMGDLAYYTADNASNLARDFASASADLSGQAIAAAADAYEKAGDQTLLAHEQALQFADHQSRSDGQQLAINTNETMKYIVIGLGGVAILAMFMGRK